MNKTLKTLGGGFIYGIKHPFTDTPLERWNDMTMTESLIDNLGSSIARAAVGYGLLFGLVVGIGYINQTIQKTPVRVTMCVKDGKKK